MSKRGPSAKPATFAGGKDYDGQMRKQGEHDDGGGGGSATGGCLVGVGLVLWAAGGIAAATGGGAPAAPFPFGAAAALIVAGGFIYLGSTGCFVQGTMVATAAGDFSNHDEAATNTAPRRGRAPARSDSIDPWAANGWRNTSIPV